ncbi:AraC family transcriptional regulator [Coraliomargarita parva]|uniref:AraC family transcriptional regulator n=1 Tax=Coraliomargarita parva TaxID=3014050 RepID=UPI0022B2FA16|nr:AraC family transcriptional regulator [Coraliomargarita parva]
MLAYFSYGTRRYYDKPLTQHPHRHFWEFQAVLKGRIGKTTHQDASPPLKASNLWISPPGSDHGWTGEARKEATIIVLHFRYIPESLATLLNHSEAIEIPLSKDDCRQLHKLGRRVQNYWRNPGAGMLLCYEHALLELSVLAYEWLNKEETTHSRKRASDPVQLAMLWYNEHMHENPGLPEIARQANSSPANLRRHFHECLQASPKEVFDQLRYQRAMQLLTETAHPLTHIAEQCGFLDQSAFSRAFKTRFHCSPREIRRPHSA